MSNEVGFEEAFNQFNTEYAALHPVPETPQAAKVSRGQRFFLALTTIGSAVFSAFHSVPVLLGSIGIAWQYEGATVPAELVIAAVAVGLTIEMPLLGFSYIRSRLNTRREKTTDHIVRMLTAGVFITLILAFVTNIMSALQHNGVTVSEWVRTVVAVALGVAAPVVAWISGEGFALLDIEASISNHRAKQEYIEAVRLWEEARNRSWNSNKGKLMGTSTPRTEYVPGTPSIETVRTNPVPANVPKAVRSLADTLKANPDDLSMSVGAIRLKYEVGQGTAAQARSLALSEMQASN